MDLSLWGVAAPWLGWSPLGKPTGPKMGKKEDRKGHMSGTHQLHSRNSFFTSSVTEITGLSACPEYSKDPEMSVK